MLAVTYDNKTYNVDVQEMNKMVPSQGGTRRKQSMQSTRRKQKRSKPTRRIKR
jgi:hypothetical protein